MSDLFEQNQSKLAPLADRMRPRTLEEFIGQEHLLAKGRLLRRAIEADRLTSSIFYGPPGCGKTSLANVIASSTNAAFEKLNAVTSGVADVRRVIEAADDRQKLYGQATYLLLDECHRWNRSQTDAILPAIEKGIIRFIGSTTENPMIAMTPAIVSRCRLFLFEKLSTADVQKAVLAALRDAERGFGMLAVRLDEDALAHIASIANGDVRSALNALELAVITTEPDADGTIAVTLEVAEESIQQRVLQCDETLFYDMLSAFCKSLRGGATNAALAWCARLLSAGADARIIARRLIAHASEDVGLASPQAMVQAVTAAQAVELIGLPEAKLSLAQAIIFICESPKSNSVLAIHDAVADVGNFEHEQVPAHLRDTSYKGHEKLGNGVGYKYPHDYPGHVVEQEYMPPAVKGRVYYKPSDQGNEARILERHKSMIRRDSSE